MITRDSYIAKLEKRAMETDLEVDPVKNVESQYHKNMEDNRSTLTTLFSRAGDVQTNQSAEARKLFPGAEGQKESGNPLMKVARAQFMEAVSNKDLSPIYKELAFQSVCDEMQKLAKAAS